jgi:hypothetical protein
VNWRITGRRRWQEGESQAEALAAVGVDSCALRCSSKSFTETGWKIVGDNNPDRMTGFDNRQTADARVTAFSNSVVPGRIPIKLLELPKSSASPPTRLIVFTSVQGVKK